MKKHFGFICAILMLVALGLAGVGRAATDSWSGKREKQVSFADAVTLGTEALVMSASTGISHNIRAVVITNSASGVVRFYSGAGLLGSKRIGSFSVLANTPLVVTEENFGQGLATTSGEAIYVNAATGTLALQLRVREDER